MKTIYTISIARANLIAFVMIIPIAVLLATPMIIINDINFATFFDQIKSVSVKNVSLFVFAITIGIFVHELLHGLGWLFFTKKKWRAISFGIKWEYFTPYCHCNEPLSRFHFFIGAVLPLLGLGMVPFILSLITGSAKLWFYGFFFTIAAGGDIIAIWMLRKVKKEQKVQDHPSELGFIVVD